MNNRISYVKSIRMIDISLNSVFHVGDSKIISPKTKVLAVQREVPIFYLDEGNFDEFPLFSRPIPQPVVEEDINMNIINKSPFIKVDNVKIIGTSASGVFQVGSNERIESEARIKHIRQLLRGERPV